MATTFIGQKRGSGTFNVRSQNGLPVMDETYEYLVLSSSISDTLLTVSATTGLPVVGTSVSPSGVGICRSKTAKRDSGNQLLWIVTCTFSSQVDDRQGSFDPSTDPTAWIPICETKYERMQEVVTVDANGDPIVNSAGQVFPNGMTVTRLIPYWEFYQFEAISTTDEDIMDRNETVNDDTFKGRDAGTLLLSVNSSVVGFYYGAALRLTGYSLRWNRDGWKKKYLDVGETYLDDNGVLRPYLVDGRLVMGMLDTDGNKRDPSYGPNILEFDRYPELDFDSFLRV
jgi:hypothetical protein